MSTYLVKTKTDTPKRVQARLLEFLQCGTAVFKDIEPPPAGYHYDGFDAKIVHFAYYTVYALGPGNLESIELVEESAAEPMPTLVPTGEHAGAKTWAENRWHAAHTLPMGSDWMLVRGGTNALGPFHVARLISGRWYDPWDHEIKPVNLWRPIPE